MPVTVTCKWCGKKRKTHPSWTKKGRGKFCSHKCHGKWSAKHRSGYNSPTYKGGRPINLCEICGMPYRAKKKQRFCGHRCKGIHHKRLYRNKHHVTFKGGKQVAIRRYVAKYPEKKRAWMLVHAALKAGKLVKKPCEFCGTRRRLVAHHDDYSEPLKVRWMCVGDHTRFHIKKIRDAGGTWPVKSTTRDS